MSRSIQARFELAYPEFQLAVDLTLPASGITVLFGHSGSGKTTLLRCIAGLQRAPQGFFAINGQVWQDSQQGIFLATHQRSLGYVFQDANLFPHLTVEENLHFGLKRCRASSPMNVKHTLSLLGIDALLKRKPAQLSGGERQRVGIARALVLQPDILLMDEPLASLDFNRKQELLPYFMRLHRELQIPVIYVTHSQQEVAQLADYLVIMGQGRVLAAGCLTETLSRLDLALTQDQQASSVWQGIIAAHDEQYHLTLVDFAGIKLSLPAISAATDSPVRTQIFARDVSIVLEAPQASSILNILPASILKLANDQQGQCLVQLAVGTQILLARITQKSAQSLALQTGMSVYVQIKGSAILN